MVLACLHISFWDSPKMTYNAMQYIAMNADDELSIQINEIFVFIPFHSMHLLRLPCLVKHRSLSLSLSLLSTLEINLSILSKYWLLLRWFYPFVHSFCSFPSISYRLCVRALRFDFICCLWSKSRFVITELHLPFVRCWLLLSSLINTPYNNSTAPHPVHFVTYQIIDRWWRCEEFGVCVGRQTTSKQFLGPIIAKCFFFSIYIQTGKQHQQRKWTVIENFEEGNGRWKNAMLIIARSCNTPMSNALSGASFWIPLLHLISNSLRFPFSPFSFISIIPSKIAVRKGD